MKHYQLVIFDWDGTVMDSVGRIVSSMQMAALDVGLNKPNVLAVKNIIGLSLPVAVEELFPGCSAQQLQALKQRYKNHYIELDDTPTPIFPYARQLFDSLKARNKLLAVATGKAREGLERVWAESATKHYFDGSRCAYECESKPHPDMLEQLMAQFNVSPADTLMIGDTSHDLNMAMRAGVDSIGVTFGAHAKDVLATCRPKAIVDNYQEIQQLLI